MIQSLAKKQNDGDTLRVRYAMICFRPHIANISIGNQDCSCSISSKGLIECADTTTLLAFGATTQTAFFAALAEFYTSTVCLKAASVSCLTCIRISN